MRDRKKGKVSRGVNELGTLYFKTNGTDHQLIQTNEDFEPIAKDNKHTLYKRSKLFTVEGYVTVEPRDNTEFFERNTSENWHVARIGLYDQVRSTYKELAKLPYEGIYLRALAYSVADTTSTGDPGELLVIKKVIKMEVSH